ncbi:MAG: phosphonate ABC transporter ATP-binding protein [Planctomycetota bacterium]|nr:phosphonate ABC transporter ATP-binding protein [Planctomycetota bacterium]
MIAPGQASGFRLDGVSVRFGTTAALSDVNLHIEAGEAVALVGPSGAGKSTLLRLLNGTVRPTSGRVYVDGDALASLSRAGLKRTRAAIGFVHQDLSLVPNLRVVQNVMAGRLGRQGFLSSARSMLLPRQAEARRAYELLERVGIPEKLYARTDTLSGGQQQRVAVARALYQQPVALLADEPVSSVDPARARDTVELLTRISREEGLTLVMSIHNLELARECFPRLVGLRAGRLVFDESAGEVGEDEFHALYDLQEAEMLADGA